MNDHMNNTPATEGRAPVTGSASVDTYWYPLWKHMHDEHGLILVDDECNQIARAAEKCGQPHGKADNRCPDCDEHGDVEHFGPYGTTWITCPRCDGTRAIRQPNNQTVRPEVAPQTHE